MKTKQFLTKVLSPADNTVLFLARGKSSWNENYTDLDDCIEAIHTHDNSDTTVYMAIGAFADNVHPHPKTGRDYVQRRKHQATKFRALAVDLDVGESDDKYDTQKEAVQDMARACKALHLPSPMVVLSGGGAHVYWPFDTDIDAERWEKMSLTLRAALESEHVKLDVSKISDRSMVLRPAGAHHKKDPDNWKEVRVVFDAPARPVMEYATALKKFVSKAKPVSSPSAIKKRQSAVFESIMDGGNTVRIGDMARCPQLAAMLASAGAMDATGNPVTEPLWRASLGIAKFCEDREDAARQLSSGHPDYNETDCLDKLQAYAGTGPTTCSAFENHCPSPCETCEHYGKITSPAQLTGGVTAVEVTVADTGEDQKIELPANYSVKHNRNIYYQHPYTKEDIFVAPYLMWVVARVTDAEENTNCALIAVEFPRVGVKTITVDSALIAVGGNDLRKALADKQVYIKTDINPLRDYLMTFLRQLQDAVEADVSYSHFGWQNDGSFLLGTQVIGSQVSVDRPHLEGVARAFKERLTPRGDLATWARASRIFDLPGMEFQNFSAMLALGAPLLQGAHFPSAMVNMYSKDSGSGKTLAGKFGVSAWGNPEILGAKAKDTEAAFYKSFGVLKNMGAYIDEMTTMDTDQLRKFVMCIQDGKERDRVKQDASGFRHAASWRMPIITSSNKDMYEQLGSKMQTEAEELRILQLSCPRVKYLEDHGNRVGYRLQILLERNHGLAGPLFIEEVIRMGGPEKVYEHYVEEFEKEFGFEFMGQERFYRGLVIVAYAAGKLYKKLGLIQCDTVRAIRAVIKEVLTLRDNRVVNKLDGFDLLAQFMTERQSDIVYYYTTPTNSYAMQPTPRSAVARVELDIDANDRVLKGMIFINSTAFKKWGARNGAEARSTINELTAEGVKVRNSVRKTLYRGVQGASSSGQTRCFAIDIMSHKRLVASVDDSRPELDTPVGRKRLEEVTT